MDESMNYIYCKDAERKINLNKMVCVTYGVIRIMYQFLLACFKNYISYDIACDIDTLTRIFTITYNILFLLILTGRKQLPV